MKAQEHKVMVGDGDKAVPVILEFCAPYMCAPRERELPQSINNGPTLNLRVTKTSKDSKWLLSGH